MAEQSQAQQEIAHGVKAEYTRASADRGSLEAHWEETARLVIPAWSGSFTQSSARTEGEKRTQHQYDSTAATALGRFAAVMESMLTPRNQTWHRIVPSDPALMKSRSVRLWFEQATDIIFKYRNASNFQNQRRETYMSLGAFGTGGEFIDAASTGGFRYRAMHPAEVYFFENHEGRIDRVLRRFELTARQAYQKWGEAGRRGGVEVFGLPEEISQVADKQHEKKFWFLHCVKPREDRDVQRSDYKGKPWVSYYVAEAKGWLVEEGGYNSFPYTISRYVKVPGEVYGRSPAMEALPAIKVLNEEKKTLLKQGHRTVDPVLLAHDDGVLDSFSLKPGAVNYGGVSAEGRPLVHTLPVGNLALAKDMMDMERVTINDSFLITLFQILVEQNGMTATEVMERAREKGMLLSPTMGRQQTELLQPQIEREMDLAMMQGLLPAMPPELVEARGDYEIVYDSPLSRAQKAEEAAGIMRTVESALAVVNVTQNPEPLDHFNWDAIIPELGDIQGVPVRWMRSLDEVKAIRAGRAKQAQVQQAIDAAPAAASMMKNMAPQAA